MISMTAPVAANKSRALDRRELAKFARGHPKNFPHIHVILYHVCLTVYHLVVCLNLFTYTQWTVFCQILFCFKSFSILTTELAHVIQIFTERQV